MYNDLIDWIILACGIQGSAGRFRIVGGEESKIGEWPWLVAIMHKGKIHCGAALINDKFLLSAAHCYYG